MSVDVDAAEDVREREDSERGPPGRLSRREVKVAAALMSSFSEERPNERL